MAYTNESMSARTFDFRSPASLSFEVVAVPPNFQLTGVGGARVYVVCVWEGMRQQRGFV